MSAPQMLRQNLRSGRATVWGGMAGIVALGWLYMVHMNAGMSAMDGMAPPAAPGLGALVATFLMWTVMMVAMMLPSTIPAVSVFMMLAGRRNPLAVGRMTMMFVTGYAFAWSGYCVPAALAQWGLSRIALLSPMGESSSTALSAAILIAAGLFQFTPLKEACITKCRAPFAFLMHEWRDGAAGALVVGMRHGTYCVGCCWALMAVMFVVGTMNLVWMALLALLVMAEKIVPAHWRVDWIVGIGFIVWGGMVAAGGIL